MEKGRARQQRIRRRRRRRSIDGLKRRMAAPSPGRLIGVSPPGVLLLGIEPVERENPHLPWSSNSSGRWICVNIHK